MRSKDELFNLELERPIRKAFTDDVSAIKFRMRPLALIRDIETLGTSTALERALDPNAFGDTFMALLSAYHQSGKRAAKQAPWNTPFSLQERSVESFIQETIAQSIEKISQAQKFDVSAAIQDRLAQKWSPTKIVKELIGQKQAGGYRGGLIGLTKNGIISADNARQQLLALDKDYFTRKLRVKKYDAIVEKAIRSGKPLTAKQIENIINGYQAKLLESRAKMLALTEVTTAVNKTKLQTFIKAANAAGVSLDELEKAWHTVGDSHVRFTHRALEGQMVTLSQKFVSPSGALLEYPGDPSAPYEERAGCRCHMRIKWKKAKAI